MTLREFIPIFERAVAFVEGVTAITGAPHLMEWADIIERNRFVCIVAFRGSLKSTIAKAVIAHALACHAGGAYDAVYYSATIELARWHLRRLKLYIAAMGLDDWHDATVGEAMLRYIRGGDVFACEPAGLDQASRGRRANLLVLDDVSDPRKLASMTDITRALESLQRRVLPLMKDKSSRVILVGTPLIAGDVIEWAERNPEFTTVRMPILDALGRPTWPEKYPIDEIARLRSLVGEKAFLAEYMLQAVAPVDTFIDPSLLQKALFTYGDHHLCGTSHEG